MWYREIEWTLSFVAHAWRRKLSMRFCNDWVRWKWNYSLNNVFTFISLVSLCTRRILMDLCWLFEEGWVVLSSVFMLFLISAKWSQINISTQQVTKAITSAPNRFGAYCSINIQLKQTFAPSQYLIFIQHMSFAINLASGVYQPLIMKQAKYSTSRQVGEPMHRKDLTSF